MRLLDVSVSALEILIRNRLSPTNTQVIYNKNPKRATKKPEPHHIPRERKGAVGLGN
jgi:hypothetical protein